MSVHYEWVEGDHLELLERGALIGEGEVDDELALCIGFDSVAVVEGTVETLRKLTMDATVHEAVRKRAEWGIERLSQG